MDEMSEPKDGRPCNTDVFLAALLETYDDKWDIHEAIVAWVHGDWQNATTGIPPESLAARGAP